MDRYIGKRLDGRYEIREIVGEGGMARVYKAYDNQENRLVAIKILKEEFLSNDEFLRRFKNESKAIAMLSHPNIVNVFDVSFGDVIQYIVMEYIEGITLKEYIENEGSLRWKDAVHFATQILKGLQHAHDKGIVHRDVKPQNIMVLNDGTIKVTDFGIARFSRSDQRTITDKAIGSVHYISPEQARGEKTDEKADVYSVGVMLYEMITGKLPFQAESAVSVAIMQLQRDPQRPTEINASIPEGLEQITMHAMQKSPDKRYQSASEMLCDLADFKKDPAITFSYNYFVDDSPTRFVGGAVVDTAEKKTKKTSNKERGGFLPILAGIAIAVILATIILVIAVVGGFFGNPGKGTVSTPKFIGLKYEDIINNEDYDVDFNFKDEWAYNTEYPYGYVYEQSIKEGATVKSDTDITLYVSMGSTAKKVNDVRNMSKDAAVNQLESNGFKTVVTEISSLTVEKGCVIRTDPRHDEVVPEGATITVYVSKGKSNESVTVPNVTKQPFEQAQNTLADRNLLAEIEKVDITWNQKFQPEGYVIKQNPGASSKLLEGSIVTLYVSTGKYGTNITVKLPSGTEDTSCTVALYSSSGTALGTSGNIDITTPKSHTFKNITSKESSASFTVKITGNTTGTTDYASIDVDFTASSEAEGVKIYYLNEFNS